MQTLGTAWRNVRRNRRRTVLNVAALTVGVLAMVVMFGWIEGYHTYVYGAIIDLDTGHVQVENAAYREQARRLPLDVTVPQYRAVQAALSARQEVIAAAGRIEFTLKLSSGARAAQLMGRAIDPAAEAEVTLIERAVVDGWYLEQRPGLLLSRALAGRFEVGPGDTMFVTAVDRYGVDNLLDVPVAGIFDYNYPAIDNNIVFFDLATARQLLRMGDEVTRVVVRLAERVEVGAGIGGIEGLLGEFEAPSRRLAARSWREFARAAVIAVEQDSVTFQILVGIIYFLVLIGILNSMSMSVHERTSEIATLRAVGMKRGAVARLFLCEGLILGLIGFVVGVLLALPLVYYLGVVGLDIGQFMPEDFPAPFGELFFADFRPRHFVIALLTALGATGAASFLPARRAARLQIADAMRSAR